MYKTTVVVDGMHCSMCESQVKSLDHENFAGRKALRFT